LLHVYGPTETTTFATWYPVIAVAKDAKIVPIGGPIANTRIYVLDARLNPVPIGATGELYIGGAGVALGYLQRDELTAERFVRDPFSADPRGGCKDRDLGRWRADGAIEYLGAMINQVKSRFRIELGRSSATGTTRADRGSGGHCSRRHPRREALVAYYTDGFSGLGANDLRMYLAGRLPEYMVPAAYVRLDALPLTRTESGSSCFARAGR